MKEIEFDFVLKESSVVLKNDFHCSTEGFVRMSELFSNYEELAKQLAKAEDKIRIYEGALDCIAAHEIGYRGMPHVAEKALEDARGEE